jgi:LacI family transcriptional regulator
MFDRVVEGIACDKIIIDDVAAAQSATEFLMRKGRKNLAIISTVDYVNVGRLRTQGFKEALLKRGLEFKESSVLRIEDAENCTKKIENFLKKDNYDGVVAVNELFAVIASKAYKKMGKSIPEDVAIIAFTDGMLSKYASPTLTTIGQKGEDMGGLAAAKLIERLEGKQDVEESYETVIVKTSLIERESTP